MSNVDWVAWYLDTLDALIEVIKGSPVTWATDPEGNQFVIAGDRQRSGLEFPACFIPSFAKGREAGESTARSELHDIQTTLLILHEGDSKDPEGGLRKALELAAQVENALYDNRSLKVDLGSGSQRHCERVTVTDTTPFAGPTDSGSLYGAEVIAEIRKQADHH